MVSFYGTGYASLLLYITRKQTAVNGRIYSYTAYHKSKKVTSEARVYFGTDLEWWGILLCSDTPKHSFLRPSTFHLTTRWQQGTVLVTQDALPLRN